MALSNRQMSSEDSWRGRHGLTMRQTQTLYSFFRSLWSHLRGGPQLHREAVKSGSTHAGSGMLDLPGRWLRAIDPSLCLSRVNEWCACFLR